MGGDSTSSESTTTMNPMYAAAATYSTLSQLAMSQDLWNITKPYYEDQLNFSNDVMNPYYKELYQDSTSLLPSQTELSQAQIQDSLGDIQRNQEVKDTLTQEQLKELNESSPVREAFYQAALKGVDPDYEQLMGQATADVAQGYAGADSSIRRSLAKAGLGTDSGAYATALANQAYNEAKDKAYARTNAYMTEKNNVETQDWNRLATATQTAGRASGLAGVSDSSENSASSRTLTSASNTNPYSSSDASAGTSTALSGVGSAAGNFINLGKSNFTTDTESTKTEGAGSIIGSVLGTALGGIGQA